jgi:hypothetical protein
MSALDAALNVIARGWNPVPVKYRSKEPIGEEWQKRVITKENAAKFFNGTALNIGVILGPTSNNLADVGLDAQEAITIAPYVLTRTDCIWGASQNAIRIGSITRRRWQRPSIRRPSSMTTQNTGKTPGSSS